MTTHTFTLGLNGTDQVVWSPHPPKDQTSAKGNTPIMVDDIVVFKAPAGCGVHLRFHDKSPFKPQASPAPFEYHSPARQDLVLTVVGPPRKYPFACGIRQQDGQVIGLSNAGDQIPVGQ
jgi:hypothetical protein